MASGPVPASTSGGDGRGHRGAGQGAAEVAHVVDGGGAVLAEGAGHGGGPSPQATASTVPARARAWLISSREVVMGCAVGDFGEDPDLSMAWCRSFS